MKVEQNSLSESGNLPNLNKLQAVQLQPEIHMSNAYICKDGFSGETIQRQPS